MSSETHVLHDGRELLAMQVLASLLNLLVFHLMAISRNATTNEIYKKVWEQHPYNGRSPYSKTCRLNWAAWLCPGDIERWELRCAK